MISVCLANARTTQIKINVEPPFTQYLGAIKLPENALYLEVCHTYYLVQACGKMQS